MSSKRLVLLISCLLLALGGAFTAQAKQYLLTGGGGELAIGQGLPLPPQVFATTVTGPVFPPLLIPVNLHRPVLSGTTTAGALGKLTVPGSALKVAPAQRTIGLFLQNPTLYAVATNLGWAWPASPAVLSTGARTGATTTTFTAVGGSARYSDAGPVGKFGGPARFAITYGAQPQGRINNSPVTIYAVAVRPTGNPPCTHPALIPPFPGTFANPACVAALGGAWPASQGAIGGPVGLVQTTAPLGNPVPGIGIGKFGATPPGTVTFFTFTPNGNPGFTNMATSAALPWTTGMLSVSHPLAAGAPEFFTLTGSNNRTVGGAGTIQLVSGSLSLRATSGPNANRGWVRLELTTKQVGVPSISPAGLAATAGLMLLAVAYVVRRRLSA